jgi:hypothetical protein
MLPGFSDFFEPLQRRGIQIGKDLDSRSGHPFPVTMRRGQGDFGLNKSLGQ